MNIVSLLYTIIIYPLIQIVEISFVFAQRLFNKTGLSVLFVSAVITILCLPLYAVAEKWQQLERNIQARLKRGTDRIKAVFKGDEQYMILSTFYKQNHYHPMMALRSSFGLLIQIPFFIAAYNYLSNLEILRGTSFFFLRDLGAPDSMFKIGNFSVNVLPIAMTLINCIAGMIYAKGFSFREHIQLYGMALIFLVLLYNSPSGLVLYWTMNNIFSLLKNVYYKIDNKNKLNILLALFSVLLVFVIIYANLKHRGSDEAREMMSIALCIFIIFLNAAPIIFSKFKYICTSILEKTIPLKNAYILFILSTIAIAVFLGLFVSSNLINASPQEFSYIDQYSSPNFFIANTFFQFFGLCIFWPVCLFFLFSDNVKRILAIMFSSFFFCAVLNFFVFSGNYGNISNVLVFDGGVSHTGKQAIENLCAIAAMIIFVCALVLLKKYKVVTTLASLIFVAVLVLGVANIYQVSDSFKKLASYQSKEDAAQLTKIEPIVSLSKHGTNVVIIMLDRAESVLVPYILEDYPVLKKEFDGFVFYPNTITFNGHTRIGAPPIFGGYEYSPIGIAQREDVPLVDKINEALKLMPHIFSENGFNVTATDLPYAGGYWISDMSIFDSYENVTGIITDGKYTDLWCAENNLELPLNSDILKRNIAWYALMRSSPIFIRETIYNYGNWFALLKNVSLRKTIDAYAVLDYLPLLCSIADNDSDNVLIMDNNTTHEYFYLQAPEYRPVTSVTQYGAGKFAHEIYYSVNVAALMRLAEWFEYLRKNDAYNNTKIILVSDHGDENNIVTSDNLPINRDQYTSFLMVKDFAAHGEIKSDNTFMCNADVPTIAFEGIIKNPRNPFTGVAINSDAKNQPLYIVKNLSNPEDNYKFILNPNEDYYVSENIFDINNWRRVK